jgi:hypothetical protein
MALEITVGRTKRKFEEEMRVKINRRLDAFFDLNRWEYGQDLKELDIVKALVDMNEIKTVNIEFTTDDPDNGGELVIASYYQIIRPDTIDISFTYE